MCFTPLAGALADKPQRRKPLLIGGVATASAGLGLTGIAPVLSATSSCEADPAVCSLPAVIAGLVLIGVGVALVDTPALPSLAAVTEKKGVSLDSAAAIETVSVAFGYTLAPFVAAPLAVAFDDPPAPWLEAGLAPAAWGGALFCALQLIAMLTKCATLSE